MRVCAEMAWDVTDTCVFGHTSWHKVLKNASSFVGRKNFEVRSKRYCWSLIGKKLHNSSNTSVGSREKVGMLIMKNGCTIKTGSLR
jgi:hypothetical protein